MTINISQLFAPAQLGTSLATYLTIPSTPASNTLMNGRVRFTNTTSGAVTVTAHAVESGGSASDSNAICKDKSIPANDFTDIDLPLMGIGDFFQAKAGAATSITVSCLGGIIFSNG